jgi:hypothetical protein
MEKMVEIECALLEKTGRNAGLPKSTNAFISKAFLGSGASEFIISDFRGSARRTVHHLELLDESGGRRDPC